MLLSSTLVAVIPNDPLLLQQWALGPAGINGIKAQDKMPVTKLVAVGIIGTGLDYNHPDLKDNIWVNPQEIPNNHIDDDNNGYVDDVYGINTINGTGDPMDDHGNGTQIAGIIGAVGNNGLGISGVIPKVALISCKALDAGGNGTIVNTLECLNYFLDLVARNKDALTLVAVHNSWSKSAQNRPYPEVVQEYQKQGILYITSAGKDGQDNDQIPVFPANSIEANAISVGATDRFGALAKFSNYGKHSVHVLAPGEDIITTILGGKFAVVTSTSAAAAIVTGMAAYLKADQPTRDYVSIKNLIMAGGEPIPSASATTISGRRVRQIDSNGRGSLSCHNQLISTRTQPKTNEVTLKLGTALQLAIRNINCDQPAPPPASTPPYLNDLGQDGDEVAHDGRYTGQFRPTTVGTYKLPFYQDDILTVHVVN